MKFRFRPRFRKEGLWSLLCRLWGERLRRLAVEQAGQDLVEYALVAVFIALGTVVALQGVAGKAANVFAAVGNTLTGNA